MEESVQLLTSNLEIGRGRSFSPDEETEECAITAELIYCISGSKEWAVIAEQIEGCVDLILQIKNIAF